MSSSGSGAGVRRSGQQLSSAFGNILVAVRIRQKIDREKNKDDQWEWKDNQIWSRGSTDPSRRSQYDRVFTPADGNERVYSDVVSPVIDGVVRGYNATVFAYGQSSSGKTHTMLGTEADPGVMRRAVDQIFKHFSELSGGGVGGGDGSGDDSSAVRFLIRVSYFEIYQEKIKDLLSEPGQKNPPRLVVQEDKDGNSTVTNLTEVPIQSPDDIFDLLEMGEQFRHYGVTNVNDHSSRSHAIFRLIVESLATETATVEDGAVDGGGKSGKASVGKSDAGGKEVSGKAITVSHLNLVDLAGSERASETGATGERLKEGAQINNSLMVLGQVITKLSEGEAENGGFIPYRNSNLTRILKNSLGGNSGTAMICTVTPVDRLLTRSTLDFATRAKKIVQKAHKNEILDERAHLARLQNVIRDKDDMISELRAQVNSIKDKEDMIDHLKAQVSQIQHKENVIKQLQEKILFSGQAGGYSSPSRNHHHGGGGAGGKGGDRRKSWHPSAARRRSRLSMGFALGGGGGGWKPTPLDDALSKKLASMDVGDGEEEKVEDEVFEQGREEEEEEELRQEDGEENNVFLAPPPPPTSALVTTRRRGRKTGGGGKVRFFAPIFSDQGVPEEDEEGERDPTDRIKELEALLEEAETKYRQTEEELRTCQAEADEDRRRVAEKHQGDIDKLQAGYAEDITELRAKIEEIKEEKEKFVSLNDTAERTVKGLEDQCESLIRQKEQSAEALAVMEAKLAAETRSVSAKLEELSEAELQNRKLLEEAEAKVQRTEEELQRSQARADKERQVLAEKHQDEIDKLHAGYAEDVTELEAKIQMLEGEKEKAVSLRDMSDSTVKTLEAKCELLIRQGEQSAEALAVLEAKLAAETRSVSTKLEEKLSEADLQNRKLLEEAETKARQAEEELRTSQARADEERQTLAAKHQDEIDKLHARYAEDITELETKIKVVEGEKEMLVTLRDTSEKMVKSLEAKCESLIRQTEQSEEALSILKAEATAETRSVSAKLSQAELQNREMLEEAENKARQAEEELRSCQARANEDRQKLTDRHQDEIDKLHEGYAEDVTELETKIKVLEGEMTKAAVSLRDLNETVKSLEAKNDSLMRQKEQSAEALAVMEAKLAAETRSVSTKLEEKLSEAELQNRKLLEKAETKARQAEEDLQTSQARADEERRILADKHQDEIDKLHEGYAEDVTELESKIKVLEGEKEKFVSLRDTSERMVKSLETKCESLMRQRKQSAEALAVVEAELSAETRSARSVLGKLEEKLSEAELQNKELKTGLSVLQQELATVQEEAPPALVPPETSEKATETDWQDEDPTEAQERRRDVTVVEGDRTALLGGAGVEDDAESSVRMDMTQCVHPSAGVGREDAAASELRSLRSAHHDALVELAELRLKSKRGDGDAAKRIKSLEGELAWERDNNRTLKQKLRQAQSEAMDSTIMTPAAAPFSANASCAHRLSTVHKQTMTDSAVSTSSPECYANAMSVFERGAWGGGGSGIIKEFALEEAKERVARLKKENEVLKSEREHYKGKAQEWKTKHFHQQQSENQQQERRRHNGTAETPRPTPQPKQHAVAPLPLAPVDTNQSTNSKAETPSTEKKSKLLRNPFKSSGTSSVSGSLKRWGSFKKKAETPTSSSVTSRAEKLDEDDEEFFNNWKLEKPKRYNSRVFLENQRKKKLAEQQSAEVD